MLNKQSLFLFSFLLLILCGAAFFLYSNQPKIGYVRSEELIYGYLGTKEAREEFSLKRNSLEANVDTLQVELERSIYEFNNAQVRLSSEEKEEERKRLQYQQNQLFQYSQSIQKKIKAEDQEMMNAVLNQINSFIEKYAEEKGYDIILGSTASGNLLYGEKGYDVTVDLLEELNNHYKGE